MSLPDNTQRSLGRMEGKMDALLVSISQIGASLSTESAERKAADLGLDGRVRTLEDMRSSFTGGLKAAHLFTVAAAGAIGAGILKVTGLLTGTH